MGHEHAHHHFPTDIHGEHARLMRFATYASVSMASVLLLAKLYTWWQTGSLAMLSSLTDSAFDVLMSVVNMLALRYALKPADDDHRFGHTSIEDIAGLAQCAFIAASMALIMLQSFERLTNPQPITHGELGIGVSLLALGMTTVLVLFQTYVARKTKSLIVAADRLHYLGDILFNLGVMVAFALSMWGGFTAADPLMAIIIAIVMLWSTKPLAIRAFNNLMDREMPDAEKAELLRLVEADPDVRAHHKLKTRYAGNKPFIQLHIDIDAGLSFHEAHTITERLEHALEHAFPGAEVIIHPDPAA